jgi:hypothetical protein
MQYMLLVYDDPKLEWPAVTEEETKAIEEYARRLHATRRRSIARTAQPTEAAKTVRVKNDSTLVTDGPFRDEGGARRLLPRRGRLDRRGAEVAARSVCTPGRLGRESALIIEM